ncbi:hypothetical protein RUMTOR_00513 [[Ruminococcus] torques ATCC 27756]|uniref:Uncharacterized protein n=1 Tax=[Ruminococcus] torques ATCC 27756 TaxID=411460 RepID=A5KJW5_9FIRM|nr:hypothetical protein RUMTOR_00513 [[Ruminococcus] torques ATCC 27756]
MLKRENHIEIDRRKFYKTVLALLEKKLYPAHLWQDRFSIL